MIFNYNNIILFNTINNLCNNLNNNFLHLNKKFNIFDNILPIHFIDKNSISFGINNNNNYYDIRIWKNNNKLLFNNNDIRFNNDNIIACIDYNINDTNIYIRYFYINDKILNENEVNDLNKSLLNYIYNIAIDNKISKIIIDVHYLLKNYNKFFKNENFIIKNNCDDNPFWLKTEKIL